MEKYGSAEEKTKAEKKLYWSKDVPQSKGVRCVHSPRRLQQVRNRPRPRRSSCSNALEDVVAAWAKRKEPASMTTALSTDEVAQGDDRAAQGRN